MDNPARTRIARSLSLLVGAITLVVLALGIAGTAHAAPDEAAGHFERGRAAFALHEFAAAAHEFEAAFRLASKPQYLYDAAQAHRHAGYYARALELYQSYVQLFGDVIDNVHDAEKHIADLKAIMASRPSTTSAPAKPVVEKAAAPSTPTPTPPATTTPTPTNISATPPRTLPATMLTAAPRDGTTRVRPKKWIWAVAGGAVTVVGVAFGLGFGLSGTRLPQPSLGATAVK